MSHCHPRLLYNEGVTLVSAAAMIEAVTATDYCGTVEALDLVETEVGRLGPSSSQP